MEQRDLDTTALVAGALFVILGILFLFERVGFLVIRAAYVWPLVLIGLGVVVLLGGSGRRGPARQEPSGTLGGPDLVEPQREPQQDSIAEQ